MNSRWKRSARAAALAVVALLVAVPSGAGASFVVGASTTSGAANTCTVTALKPVVSSGIVSSSFTVKCTVATTVYYTLDLREADGTVYQRLIATTSSSYLSSTSTTYTIKTSSGLSCTSVTPLYTGANTESSREELYTFVEVSFGSYAARSEQTAIPAENSTASFAC